MKTAEALGTKALGAPCPASGTWVSVPAIPLRLFKLVILRQRRRTCFCRCISGCHPRRESAFPLPVFLSTPPKRSVISTLSKVERADALCRRMESPPHLACSYPAPSFGIHSHRTPGRARPEAFASASARSIAAYNWSGSVTSIQWCAVATTRVGVCITPVRLPRAQSASTSAAQCPEGSMTKGITCL